MKFEEIVNRYTNLAYKIAIDMTSSPEDAQDLVQEAYLSLYSHYKEYKKLQEKEIKNILCRIVLNKCRDYLRSNKRKENTILEEITNLEDFNLQEDFIDDLIKRDTNDFIKGKILELKKPYDKILTQYYIQEYSLEEIAKNQNTTKGTIKVQLTRGKKILKEILRKERILWIIWKLKEKLVKLVNC